MLLEEVIGVGLWELTLALYTMSPYAARQLQSESWAGQEQKKKKKKKNDQHHGQLPACLPALPPWPSQGKLARVFPLLL